MKKNIAAIGLDFDSNITNETSSCDGHERNIGKASFFIFFMNLSFLR